MGRTSKDKRDIYYRKAKALRYRARSAFKLEQLDEELSLFEGVKNVVDLCAAPGSWSQYTSRRLCEREDAKIIAIDLQEMVPIDGVYMMKADITSTKTLEAIREYVGNQKADIVLSDGAPDVLGLPDIDEYVQTQLVLAALAVAKRTLRVGGTFVAKVFRQRETDRLYGHLGSYFDEVMVAKPRCSRATSIEAFVVCRNFRPNPTPPIAPCATLNRDGRKLVSVKRKVVQFVSAGDADALDSNKSYALDMHIPGVPRNPTLDADKLYVSLPPVIPPIEPPYAEAIRRLGSNKTDEASKDGYLSSVS